MTASSRDDRAGRVGEEPRGVPALSRLARSLSPSASLAETPASLRRLMLSLYAIVGPVFCTSLFVLGNWRENPWPLVAVVALIAAASAWLLARPAPGVMDWIFSVAVSPTLCCGIGFAACGDRGLGFLAVAGAPIAWAAVLFEPPVALAALLTAVATVFATLSLRLGVAAGAVCSFLLAPVAALVAWVVFAAAHRLREIQRHLQEVGQRDRALLQALPDTLVRVDREGRLLDAATPGPPPASPLPPPHPSLYDLVPSGVAERVREAVRLALAAGAAPPLEYESLEGGEKGSFEVRFARSGENEAIVIRRDVTEQRRAESDQRFLGALVAQMQEAVITVDLDLRVRSWSPGAQALYGWKAEEATGRPFTTLLQPQLGERQARAFAANLASQGVDRAVVRQVRKDGVGIVVDANVAALKDAGGTVTGFLAVCRDVTAQKAAEDALRDSEERYRSVVTASGEGIVMRRADGTISAFNSSAERILGVTAEEVQNLSMDSRWRTLKPDGTLLPAEERPNRVTLRTGRPQTDFVMGIQKPDESLTWVSVNCQPVAHDGAPLPYAVVTTYRDVTAQRQQAEELKQSRQRLADAIEGSNLGCWDWNAQTGQIRCDRLWPELLGYGPDELAPFHRDWVSLVHAEDSRRLKGVVLAHLKGRTPTLDTEYRMRGRDGSWRWIHTRGKAVEWDADGRVVRLVGTHADVTRRRDAEERLRDTVAANEKLVAELREALANVRTLTGLLPICAWCKKVRNDAGYWEKIEAYVCKHTDAQFTHGVCPECLSHSAGDEGEASVASIRQRP